MATLVDVLTLLGTAVGGGVGVKVVEAWRDNAKAVAEVRAAKVKERTELRTAERTSETTIATTLLQIVERHGEVLREVSTLVGRLDANAVASQQILHGLRDRIEEIGARNPCQHFVPTEDVSVSRISRGPRTTPAPSTLPPARDFEAGG